MGIAKNLLRFVLKSTRYELAVKQERLPAATLDTLKLVFPVLFQMQPQLNYVQVGAYDGQTDDPAHEFVRTGKMRCLLVEPIEASYLKLRKIYDPTPNVTLVQAAVGATDGQATMYKVRAGTPSQSIHSGGWTSFDKAHLIKHKVPENEIETVTVPCLTLGTLLKNHGLANIDILQIDTEGFDAEIVKMALQLPAIPAAINFENIHLSLAAKDELYELLTGRGYLFTHDKYNTLALHRRVLENLPGLLPHPA